MTSADRIMTGQKLPGNRVREIRLSRGWSQSILAEHVGVSRTAITAIEADGLSPSVTTALALARVLKTTVEELFGEPTNETGKKVWAWNSQSKSVPTWEAIIDGRSILYPATATATLTELPDWQGEIPADGRCPVANDTLVLATCDPAVGLLANHFSRTTGMRLLVLSRSSTQSLEMLRDGLVHVCGIHLSTQDDQDRNATYARGVLREPFQLLRVANWQEGIAISPKARVRSVGSALKSKLKWVGRDLGSGAGQCLSRLLNGRSMPRRIAESHRSVAEAIRSGWAEIGVCIKLVAEGLDFVPVQEEAYDICYHSKLADDRRFRAFLSAIRSPAYRKLLAGLPGYDCTETGSLSSVYN
jgi:putative molybdopterin biosynthesis protein